MLAGRFQESPGRQAGSAPVFYMESYISLFPKAVQLHTSVSYATSGERIPLNAQLLLGRTDYLLMLCYLGRSRILPC